MRRTIALACILLSLTACGKNPFDPVRDTSMAPPVYVPDFEAQAKNLDTPAKAAVWMQQNAGIQNWAKGWEAPANSSNHTADNVRSLAYNFWLNRDGGKSGGVGGVCGNFAGFFVYCMRVNGYRTGGILFYNQREDGSAAGHILAWVKNVDGTYSTMDFKLFSDGRIKSAQGLLDNANGRIIPGGVLYMVDDKFYDIPESKLMDYIQ
jgi:hypothetical protein